MDDDQDEDEDCEDAVFDSSADQDEDPTLPCPACGEEVYDDAERCPACGHYFSREDRSQFKKPTWIIATVLLCLLIVLLWAAFGGFQ